MAVFIIAEFGSCHDGDYLNVDSLIRYAKNAGADAAKIQFWSDSKRLAERRHMTDWTGYERYRVPYAWLPRMEETCRRIGIEMMATVYLPEDVALVDPYVRRHKVASFEAGDAELLGLLERTGKPVYVSRGMTDTEQVAEGPFRYLHCVSGYPTPRHEANIRRVQHYDGYSDHTTSEISGALAVAMGATIIEKHLRLLRTPETNPDYPHSLTQAGFTAYVKNIIDAEQLLGTGEAVIQPSEAENARYKVVS